MTVHIVSIERDVRSEPRPGEQPGEQPAEQPAEQQQPAEHPGDPAGSASGTFASRAPVFRLLGPVEVVFDGRRLDLGGPKQRCVLAVLLVAGGQLVSVERLIDAVWTEPPQTARRAVQAYVSHLRRALAVLDEPPGHPDLGELRLVGRDGGYLLEVDADHVDLHRFRELVARNEEQALSEALELWSGAALDGIGDSPYRAHEAPRLEEERLTALERRAELRLDDGDPAGVVPELLAVCAEHPQRESAHGVLMRALHDAGRLAEALEVFAGLRTRLLDRLGTEPSAELMAVHRQLLHAGGGATEQESADRARPLPVPAQLPPAPSAFAGREREGGRVLRALREPRDEAAGLRVVTITGYGGVGKTALALSAAHRAHDRFPDGRLYADLRGAADLPARPADVLGGFLHAFGVEGGRMPDAEHERAALFRSLTFGRQVLIVLDDARDEEQVRPLLPGSPDCAVLVTSRNRLGGLVDAHGLELGELDEAEATELLSGLVGAGRTAAEPEPARRLVRAASGLPLAVRLVGGRLAARPSWTLAAFADRLESTSRLDELRHGDMAVRGSFALSYRNLDPDSAWAFRVLATTGVPRPCSHLAATVLGVSRSRAERLLTGLVDLHLLQEPSPGCYRFHDLLRAFALERAREEDTEGERGTAVFRAYATYAETSVAALSTLMPQLVVQNLGLDQVARPLDFADATAAGNWLEVEHTEVTDLGHRVLDGPMPADTLQSMARLVVYLGNYAEIGGYWCGWEELGVRVLDQAHRAGDRASEMRVRMACGGAAMRRRDADAAEAMLGPAIADAAERGDRTVQGRMLAMLGVAMLRADRPEDAERLMREALEVHRAAHYHRGWANTHVNLAGVASHRGEHAEAIGHAREALRVEEGMESSEPLLRLSAHWAIGDAYAGLGRHRDAVEYFERALALAREYSPASLQERLAETIASTREALERTDEDDGETAG